MQRTSQQENHLQTTNQDDATHVEIDDSRTPTILYPILHSRNIDTE